jgi:hypothetical protein
MIGRLLVLLALLATAGGCAALADPMGRGLALENAQLRYTQHVRWGDLDAASEFVDPALRAEFLRFVPAFESIRITEYDIGRIDYADDRESATVRVTYHAYSLASAQERRIEEEQRWVRPGMGNTWWVQPRLAGLLEPFPTVQP